MIDKKTVKSPPILFIVGLTREEKARFKAYCAEKNSTMTEQVLSYIKSLIAPRSRKR